jgi:putative ABC transport system permease protein
MLARLGADLVATPDEDSVEVGQSYVSGAPLLSYMDAGVKDKIAAFDFVEQVSAQVFIVSLSNAPCCSAGNIFLIGFEPESDFTVQPWLKDHPRQPLGPNDVLVGADFFLHPGDTVRFYGHEFHIAGTLERSGAGLDRSCFIPLPAAYLMAQESTHKAVQPLPLQPGQISAVMIKLKPLSQAGVSPQEAAYQLNKGIYEISVIAPQQLLKHIAQDLALTLAALRAGGFALWPTTALLIGLVFAMAAAERQREIGLLRAMGATAGFTLRALLAEAVILAGTASILGTAVALALLAGFARLIVHSLQVPFAWPPPATLGLQALLIIALAILTASAAAAAPALRLARMEPYEAVRRSE